MQRQLQALNAKVLATSLWADPAAEITVLTSKIQVRSLRVVVVVVMITMMAACSGLSIFCTNPLQGISHAPLVATRPHGGFTTTSFVIRRQQQRARPRHVPPRNPKIISRQTHTGFLLRPQGQLPPPSSLHPHIHNLPLPPPPSFLSCGPNPLKPATSAQKNTPTPPPSLPAGINNAI